MRISFVGKGGSGKSTAASLFTLYSAKTHPEDIHLAIDADLNVHLPELLGLPIPDTQHLVQPETTKAIREILRGSNPRIPSTDASQFVKTTPPGQGSHLISLDPSEPFKAFCTVKDNIWAAATGTYQPGRVGRSCYHSTLSVVENILSHTQDRAEQVIIVDQVAGNDVLSNTLHAQFDMTVMIVEPTRRSVDVYDSFLSLLHASDAADAAAGCPQTPSHASRLYVLGNKTRSPADEAFIRSSLPGAQILGFLGDLESVRQHDQGAGGALDVNALCAADTEILEQVRRKLVEVAARVDRQAQLKTLWRLHEAYCGQYKEYGFGGLTEQIDRSFVMVGA